MKYLFLGLSAIASLASCLPPPLHPAVVAVRHEEERLPPQLRSTALHNPHLQNILPLTSSLHDGENFVYQRDADSVSRQEIYNILTHAGFLPRKPGLYRLPKYNHHRKQHNHHHHTSHHNQQQSLENFFEPPPFFHNPELLQHL